MAARHKGFTLVELLVTMAIIGTMAVISVPAYASLQQGVTLNNAAQDVVSALRQAQNLALASQDGTSHGINFPQAGTNYTRFGDTWGSPSYSITVSLPAGVGITSPTTQVTFSRLTGTTAATSITLSGFNRTKTITVSSVGTVAVQVQ